MDYQADVERIRSLMQERSIGTISDLSRVAKLTRKTVSEYLKGRQSALSKGIYALAVALEVDALSIIKPVYPNTLPRSVGLRGLQWLISPAVANYPQVAVVLFGSRVSGVAKDYSDWDLGVTAGDSTEFDFDEYFELVGELQEPLDRFPYCVDLVFLDQASKQFLYELSSTPKFVAGNVQSYCYFKGTINGIRK